MSYNFRLTILVLAALLVTPSVVAQISLSQTDASDNVEVQVALPPSPRQTVTSMLESMSGKSDIPLSTYFDTRQTTKLKGINVLELIDKFPGLLDRHGSLKPVGMLSNSQGSVAESQQATYFEEIGKISVAKQSFPILLELIEMDTGDTRWLVSQQTLLALSRVSEDAQSAIIDQFLPSLLLENTLRGAPVGQWLSMVAIAASSIFAGWLVILLLRLLTERAEKKYPSSIKINVVNALILPIGIVFGVYIFVWIERYLGISILIRQDFSIITISLFWLAVFIFLWSLMDRISRHSETVLREKNSVSSLSLVIFFRASAKVLLVLFGVILVLDNNGVNVTTGLAALGIGGIALALGAQKAIENVVGSVIIVVDQPFRVGDFCQVGNMLGTIENIGLRSTRFRTLADTLVTYPNGALSSETIENYTFRRKFLLRTRLNLRYETKTNELKNLLDELRAYLKDNKFTVKEAMRVRFIGYGAASLDVEVFVYLKANNYDQFLERQESVLLGVSQMVEQNGSGFAFPSQTIYLSRDKYGKQSD